MTETVFYGSTIINRPIFEVYNYVADVEAITEWYPLYTEVELIRPRSGSKLSFRARMALKPLMNWGPTFTVDLIDYVPGRRLSFRCLDVAITATVEFHPVNFGTLVTVSESIWGWQATTFGLFASPLRLIVNDWIAQFLANLKRRVESRKVEITPLVFFNYRRSNEYVAGRIYDALCRDFGEGYVFKDFESIKGGDIWREGIEAAVKRCSVVIVHIDDKWEETINEKIDDEDWVREELELALSNKNVLVPVFTSRKTDFNLQVRLKDIQKALPDHPKIAMIRSALVDRQGILLRTDPDFQQDLEQLLGAVWEAV